MAGAKIEIEVDDAAVLAALQRAQESMTGAGLHATLKEIGEYMLRATRELAAEEVSPDGFAWPALSPRYARRKQKLRPGLSMLKFDNHMLGDQFTWQIDGDTLLVGTNAIYGAIHQFGGTVKHAAYGRLRDKAIIPEHEATIPARPWLGVNDADAEEILAIVHDHLAAPFEGGE